MKYRVDVHCQMVVFIDVEAPSEEVARAWAMTGEALSYIEAHNQEAHDIQISSVSEHHPDAKVDVIVGEDGKEDKSCW
jgi:hypothetical protein